MTATMDTPIFKTAMKAVKSTISSYEHNHYVVTHPDPEHNPHTRTHALEDADLPFNFHELHMPQQASLCIEAMVKWAHDRGMSAAILVLVPGEKEMEQIVAEWICFTRTKNADSMKIHRVDSNTPHYERKNIRTELQTQYTNPSGRDNLVVVTDVFCTSITLYITGLLDTGLSISQDSNDFLQVGPSSTADEIQRKGGA